MKSSREINFYDENLDLKQIISAADLENTDEALNVCDLSSVVQKYRTWQKHLPRVKPYYAVKCNDDQVVVEMLAYLGAGFDCASKNEIKQVLEAKVSPSRIIFANPCKYVSHLEYAKQQKIMTGTVDNEHEIYKLFKHYPESSLVLRFRSDAREALIPLGAKFGCDADNDAVALMLLAKSLQLDVTGVSFHVGSGCNENAAYERAITTAKNIVVCGQMLNYDMKLMDIGGGFPGDDDNQFAEIASIINDSIEQHFPEADVQIIAEPGRYFVTEAFTLICKIHAKRVVYSSGNKLVTNKYYLNDGIYGCFKPFFYDHYTLTDDADSLPMFKTLICGPTCDKFDAIEEELYLPNLNSGDFMAFKNMGAYTVPMAGKYNGFMVPKTRYLLQNSLC